MEPLPEKETKITTGFSLLPSTLEKLDALCDFLKGNRSEVIGHIIDQTHRQLPKVKH